MGRFSGRPISKHAPPTWWPGLKADPNWQRDLGAPELSRAFRSFWLIRLRTLGVGTQCPACAHAPSTDLG